jgi:hypothetical protein
VAVGEDGQVQTTINQQGCIAFGSVEQYWTSAKFVGSELQVKSRTTGGSTLTMSYSLTQARDLLEKDLSNPRGFPVVAKRQK